MGKANKLGMSPKAHTQRFIADDSTANANAASQSPSKMGKANKLGMSPKAHTQRFIADDAGANANANAAMKQVDQDDSHSRNTQQQHQSLHTSAQHTAFVERKS